MSHDPSFREVQRFRQRWLWVLLGVVALVSVVSGGPFGIVVAVVVVGLLWTLRLTTEVRVDGLYVRFSPLHRSYRRVPWADVESVESVRYRPLREYGGWGIRWRPGAVAYNVSGSRGVSVMRAGQKDILVGSQRPDELAAAIREQMREASR